MIVETTVREMDYEEAAAAVQGGAALIDLRPTDDYLDVHIPGSLALLYEFGPGMAVRARDCIPLSVPFVLCDPGGIDLVNAAGSLRGKGFTVLGRLEDAINAWAESTGASPASTDVVTARPDTAILAVQDPGARLEDPADVTIPMEKLWTRTEEVPPDPVAIAAGYGVRAGLAVGILERAGRRRIAFWRTLG